jgi:MFS family permease
MRGWFANVDRSVVITAASNLGVQYNYGCVTEALLWMRALYFVPTSDPASVGVKTAVFYGTLVGMVSFGVLGDVVGRNEGMVLTLTIQAVAALLSSLAVAWHGSAHALWWTVVACRGLIGVGCGGVYPLAAAKANEDARSHDPQDKAVATAWAFFWRNPGILLYEGVGLALLLGPGAGVPEGALDASSAYVLGWDLSWRLLLLLGCLPPALMAYASLLEMREQRHARSLEAASQPASAAEPPAAGFDLRGTHTLRRATSFSGREPTSLWGRLVASRPLRPLVATAGGWACFDWGFYGNALMQRRIMATLLGDVSAVTVGLADLLVSTCAFAFLFATLALLSTRTLDVVQVQRTLPPHTALRYLADRACLVRGMVAGIWACLSPRGCVQSGPFLAVSPLALDRRTCSISRAACATRSIYHAQRLTHSTSRIAPHPRLSHSACAWAAIRSCKSSVSTRTQRSPSRSPSAGAASPANPTTASPPPPSSPCTYASVTHARDRHVERTRRAALTACCARARGLLPDGSYWLPKVTTYVLPTLAFPAEVRATLHGISAASGKVGGIVGTTVFTAMLEAYDDSTAVRRIMLTCALVAAIGGTLTLVGVHGPATSGSPGRPTLH